VKTPAMAAGTKNQRKNTKSQVSRKNTKRETYKNGLHLLGALSVFFCFLLSFFFGSWHLGFLVLISQGWFFYYS
jgi:hypothetical protein